MSLKKKLILFSVFTFLFLAIGWSTAAPGCDYNWTSCHTSYCGDDAGCDCGMGNCCQVGWGCDCSEECSETCSDLSCYGGICRDCPASWCGDGMCDTQCDDCGGTCLRGESCDCNEECIDGTFCFEGTCRPENCSDRCSGLGYNYPKCSGGESAVTCSGDECIYGWKWVDHSGCGWAYDCWCAHKVSCDCCWEDRTCTASGCTRYCQSSPGDGVYRSVVDWWDGADYHFGHWIDCASYGDHCGWMSSVTEGTEGRQLCLIGDDCYVGNWRYPCYTSSCGDSSMKCRRSQCPDYSYWNGESCRVVREYALGGIEYNRIAITSGIWNASERQCIKCSGGKESAVCGGTSNIYLNTDGTCYGGGDGLCKTICGANSACNNKTPGECTSPTSRQKCRYTDCQVVSSCGDGTVNCGEQCEGSASQVCGKCGTQTCVNCSWGSCLNQGACWTNAQDTSDCPCPGTDGCVGYDYVDYPDYGDCDGSCNCLIGTGSGQPCQPTITTCSASCAAHTVTSPSATLCCATAQTCVVEGSCRSSIGKACSADDAKDNSISELGDAIDDVWCTYNEHDSCEYVLSGVQTVNGQNNPDFWEGESCGGDAGSSSLYGEKKVNVDDISKYIIKARVYIDDNSWVWINGVEVPGLHRGCCGWTSWVDVTSPYFATGWNTIKFRAEDTCSGGRYFNLDWDIKLNQGEPCTADDECVSGCCTNNICHGDKDNGQSCGADIKCCSGNCAVDYDNDPTPPNGWCAPAGNCAHSDTATCDATCYGYATGSVEESKWLCASHSPTTLWKTCSSANDQPGKPDHQFEGYYCCNMDGAFQWQTTECSYSEQSSLGGLFKFILSLWQKLLGMLR